MELGDELKEKLGKRLRELWSRAGYDQSKEIARLLDKSEGYISQTFVGHRSPSWDFIIATCEHCHVNLSEVFYDMPEGDAFVSLMVGCSLEERIMLKNFLRFVRKKEHLSPIQKFLVKQAK